MFTLPLDHQNRSNPPTASRSNLFSGVRARREFVSSLLFFHTGKLELTEQLGGLAPSSSPGVVPLYPQGTSTLCDISS